MFEIRVKAEFSSAHRLLENDGICGRLHGHNWEVEVFFQARQLQKDEMVVDFLDIEKKLKEITLSLDHKNLNEVPYFLNKNPTAELIAKHIFEELDVLSQQDVFWLGRVRVWENQWYHATYWKTE